MPQVLFLRGRKNNSTMTGSVFLDTRIRNADLDRLNAGKIDLIVFANAASPEPLHKGNTDQRFPCISSLHFTTPPGAALLATAAALEHPPLVCSSNFCSNNNKSALLSLLSECWHSDRNILNFP